jgi:hypothetical protein
MYPHLNVVSYDLQVLSPHPSRTSISRAMNAAVAQRYACLTAVNERGGQPRSRRRPNRMLRRLLPRTVSPFQTTHPEIGQS